MYQSFTANVRDHSADQSFSDPTMDAVDQHDGKDAEAQLRRYIDSMYKGLRGANIMRMVLPHQIGKATEALRNGDAEGVSFLMLDVAGEAISVAAGPTAEGGQALSIFSLIQAQSLINLRNTTKPFDDPSLTSSQAAQKLLKDHQESLFVWVRTGVSNTDATEDESDLTRIGRHVLVDTQTRTSAAVTFLATTEVLRVGLSLFTADSNIDSTAAA